MTRSDNYCCEAFKLSGIVTDPFLLEHHLYHSVNFFLRDGSTIEEVMVLLSVLGEDVSFGRIILWRLGWRQLCCCYISLLLVHSGNIINRITDTEVSRRIRLQMTSVCDLAIIHHHHSSKKYTFKQSSNCFGREDKMIY